jgi:hypothetical protein
MLLSVYKGNRFGWSGRDEHPAYGQILFENQPTDSELIDNLREPDRTRVYRNAVTSMVSISEALGIKAILGTMAFRAERFATGVLNIPPKIALEKNPTRFKTDPAVYDALQNQVEENNETIREVASRYNAIVAETASLATEPEFFRDDCHFNREGHARRAVIFFESILESGFLTLK